MTFGLFHDLFFRLCIAKTCQIPVLTDFLSKLLYFRVNITTLPAKTKRASSKQPEEQNNKSALQSAKSFLRRLYNTSTLRLRGASRNARKMDAAEQRFQMAMAPFYEPRLVLHTFILINITLVDQM
jgi:hypothetical protein